MSNLSQFLGGGGGGLTPKFQEFNSSGTFTPTQELIDAGGYIEVLLVGGGASTNENVNGAAGGEAFIKTMYLSSTTGVSITIGAGGATGLNSGSNSSFDGSSAGGIDLTATGGQSNGRQENKLGSGSGAVSGANSATSGNGVFGYGAGGAYNASTGGGVWIAKSNSGQGSGNQGPGGSGYCLVKWYE